MDKLNSVDRQNGVKMLKSAFLVTVFGGRTDNSPAVTQQRFIRRSSAPRPKLLPSYIPFFTEKSTSFLYLYIPEAWKGHLFRAKPPRMGNTVFLWIYYRPLNSLGSLRTADVFLVVASLSPKNNDCETELQNDFRDVKAFVLMLANQIKG